MGDSSSRLARERGAKFEKRCVFMGYVIFASGDNSRECGQGRSNEFVFLLKPGSLMIEPTAVVALE